MPRKGAGSVLLTYFATEAMAKAIVGRHYRRFGRLEKEQRQIMAHIRT